MGVNFQDPAEAAAKLADMQPFVVAVAVARDYAVVPHAVKHIANLLRVVPTGRRLGDNSIECRVLEKVAAT